MQVAPLLVIASLGYAEAASTQFDLICGGVEAVFSGKQWAPQPFSEHIRVDLNGGLFCSDNCKGLRRIHRVSPSEYALLDASDGARHWERKIVARPAGRGEATAYHWRYEGQNIDRSGVCVKAEFSGFPPDAPVEHYMNDPAPTR